MVNWNINHLDRPTLTKDEQAGAALGHGLDISAAQKAKMLEDVDAAASETMSRLRDAVGAEDRAAAREAQRRKTAGINGDPQTNGGAPIPGHSCGVSCTIMPGNNFLFSGDDRGVVLMWDCRGAFAQEAAIFRRPRKRFQGGHVDAITSLAATSDGLLCSGSKDALVVVWSWVDGVKLHSLHHHHHIVTGISLATQYVPVVRQYRSNSSSTRRSGNEDDDDEDYDEDYHENAETEETGENGSSKSPSNNLPRRESSVFSTNSAATAATTTKNNNFRSARRSSVASTAKSSDSRILLRHVNQFKPWVGGVVVNHRRNNDDPRRSVTAKTLLISSSLDETIHCFEINPAGTAEAAKKQQQNAITSSSSERNKNSSQAFSDQQQHPQRRFSELMDSSATPGLDGGGTSFAFSNFTRSRTNSMVGFI